MKLAELRPQFLNSGGEGITQADGSPAPLRTGVGVLFDCPCGNHVESHQCYVPFTNPLDGGASLEKGWQRNGDTFETLTLTPSIYRRTDWGGCGWHGFITNGEVRTV